MATTDFLPFAYGGGANVLSQSDYAALTTILSGGYQSGVANSAQMNKTWRQSSIMAAVLAQFISDLSGQNSVDDGTTTTLLANLKTAVAAQGYSGTVSPANGTTIDATFLGKFILLGGSFSYTVAALSTFSPGGTLTFCNTSAVQGPTIVPTGTDTISLGSATTVNPLILQPGQTLRLVRASSTSWRVDGMSTAAVIPLPVAPATQSQHALQLGQATGRLLRRSVYFLASGVQNVSVNGANGTTTGASTFVPLANSTTFRMRLTGAGGGGGGAGATSSANVSIGGGGGAGGGGEMYYTAAQVTGAIAITIGVGGAGGNTAPTNGVTGGSTSFGSLATGTGGTGGVGQNQTAPPFTAAGGPGGSVSGSASFGAQQGPNGAFAVTTTIGTFNSGMGANSVLGYGGGNSVSVSPSAGLAGGFGAGGSGGVTQNSSGSGGAGGKGGDGMIIVEEFS